MSRAAPLAKLLLAAALAAAVLWFLFPPAERVIRKNLLNLAEAISTNPGGNIKRVANANRILGFFAPDVVIHLDGYGRALERIEGRDELTQLLMAGRQAARGARVEFYDIQIALEPVGDAATARLAALVTLEGETDPLAQEFTVRLRKMDRAWLIHEIRPVRSSAIGQ